MSAADKAKLNGVATGATANATDADLRDRATHTGEQPISSVTGLQTALDGKAAAADGITGAERTKLDGIAAGATVGADWNSNLAKIPGTFPPSAHTHPVSQISDAGALGALLVQAATAAAARGDLGLGAAALQGFDSGDNANGYWLRIGAWQVCWHYLDLGSITAFGSGTFNDAYRTATTNWTFPQQFVDGNFAFSVNARTSGASTGERGALFAAGRGRFSDRITNIQAYRMGDDATADTIFAMCIAVGRWA
jgi:hypothetical protein